MKTKAIFFLSCLLILLSCKREYKYPDYQIDDYRYLLRFKQGKTNITGQYQYSLSIGSKDTMIDPVNISDIYKYETSIDSVMPVYFNIFKDTSTFVFVDRLEKRDTVSFSYQRQRVYSNQFSYLQLNSIKAIFMSARISSVKMFSSNIEVNLK